MISIHELIEIYQLEDYDTKSRNDVKKQEAGSIVGVKTGISPLNIKTGV